MLPTRDSGCKGTKKLGIRSEELGIFSLNTRYLTFFIYFGKKIIQKFA